MLNNQMVDFPPANQPTGNPKRCLVRNIISSFEIPSGYVKIAIENGHFIVDFPVKNGDFPIKHGDFPIKNCHFP